jgi:integrase
MSKRTTKAVKTKHLVLRYNTYFAELIVPADVRHILNRTKFSKSTLTSDVKAAQVMANLFVLQWKSEIANARQTADDPIINSAIELNKLLKSQSNRDAVKDVIDEEEWKLRHHHDNDSLADTFKNIASGKQRYLKNLVADWEAQQQRKGLVEKTIAQMKSDIELLLTSFPTANLMNTKNVGTWIEYLGVYEKATPSSINRLVGSGRSFFKFLKSIKEIPQTETDPFVVPEKYKVSSKPNSRSPNKVKPWLPFEDTDIIKLHAAAIDKDDSTLAHLIQIGAYTGARIEEICSVRCADVNLEKKYISVTDSKTEAGKRQIPIHTKLLPLIKRLIKDSADDFLLSGLTLNKYQDRSNAVGKRFGRLKKDLGFDSQHVFHSIRKTLVTKLENAGISENLAADIVGHEKPRITYGLYSGGASLEVKRKALQKISYDF